MSLSQISEATGISLIALKKYSQSDENLYNISFQNAALIAKFFNVPLSLFIKNYIKAAKTQYFCNIFSFALKQNS